MNTLNFEPEQADKLVELGLRLRQIREEKAMTLEQVAAKTMIQQRLLSAIEQGKLDQLPEPVYTQGFIRRFADALGLDGAEFASTFPAKSLIRPLRPEWHQRSATQLRPIHLYLTYIVLITAAVCSLSYLVNRSSLKVGTTQTAPVQPQFPVATPAPGSASSNSLGLAKPNSPAASQLAADPTNPLIKRPATQTNHPVRVDITLKQPSWLEIVADGQTAFAGNLPSGTQRTWTAKKKLVVRSGNAGGVLVNFNDAQPKPMGKPGTVEEVVFQAKQGTAEGLGLQ